MLFNITKQFTAILILYSPLLASAENFQFGIGIDIGNDFERRIYLPIQYNNFLIEPSFEKSSHDDDFHFDSRRETQVFDIGLFKSNLAHENISLYYGSRIGYISEKTRDRFRDSVSYTKVRGYFIQPTLGASYFISNNLSLSIDLSMVYVKKNSKSEDFNNTETIKTKGNTMSYSTETSLIARYFF